MTAIDPMMQKQRGFSLIEVLVGLVIGLIGLLVVFQVVSVWSKQMQTTVAGSDAQIVGAQAMFALDRDIRQAGRGFARSEGMGCAVAVAASNYAGGDTSFTLAPVIITAGAGGAPDQIDLLYGNSPNFTAQHPFSNIANPAAAAPTLKLAFTPWGFNGNDFVIVEGPGGVGCAPLALVQVSGVTAAAVTHAATDADAAVNAITIPGFTGFQTGFLYNLGQRPQLNRWQIAVQGGASFLQVTNRFPADFNFPIPAPRQIAESVINMKAQYGYDLDNNLTVDDTEWTSVAPVAGNWNRVLAVRVAILVRSKQFEKPTPTLAAVTTTNPSWAGGNFLMTNVDGTADSNDVGSPNNWRYYRYRVYEKAIPLRNMLWK